MTPGGRACEIRERKYLTGAAAAAANMSTRPALPDLKTSGLSSDGEVFYAAACRKNERDYMEDRWVTQRAGPWSFHAVFDGHGGEDVSRWLCQNLHVHFFEWIRTRESQRLNLPTEAELKTWFASQDYDMYTQHISSHKKRFTAGSTAAIVLRHERQLWVINLGDSTVLLIHCTASKQDPQPRVQVLVKTDPHKPDKPREIARIALSGGKVTAASRNDCARVMGLAVSRSYGDFTHKISQLPNGKDDRNRYIYAGFNSLVSPVPDIGTYHLPDDTRGFMLILVSDGILDTGDETVLTVPELQRVVSATCFVPAIAADTIREVPRTARHTRPFLQPTNVCRGLIGAASYKGTEDNQTALCIDLSPLSLKAQGARTEQPRVYNAQLAR